MGEDTQKFESIISSIQESRKSFDWKTYILPAPDEIVEKINSDPARHCLTTFNLDTHLPPVEFLGDPQDWDANGMRTLEVDRLSEKGKLRLAEIIHWEMIYFRGYVSDEYQADRKCAGFVRTDDIFQRLLNWFFRHNLIPFQKNDFFLKIDPEQGKCVLFLHPDLVVYLNDYFFLCFGYAPTLIWPLLPGSITSATNRRSLLRCN